MKNTSISQILKEIFARAAIACYYKLFFPKAYCHTATKADVLYSFPLANNVPQNARKKKTKNTPYFPLRSSLDSIRLAFALLFALLAVVQGFFGQRRFDNYLHRAIIKSSFRQRIGKKRLGFANAF